MPCGVIGYGVLRSGALFAKCELGGSKVER